jgi:eukaryotic-like serine/threonine-protein kinase
MSSLPASNPVPGIQAAPILTGKEKLELCAGRIVSSEGIPPFTANANEVMARSVDPEAAASDISRTILKDVGLTAHILRVANSSLYNRSGKPILSVGHCVSLLGADAVRDHVGAMRYLEQYMRKAPGLRELAAMSLMTANHGRQFAALVEYPRPEEAYVCAMFGNLGELLAARYCSAEYARMLVSMRDHRTTVRSACLRHLGFTWNDLSLKVSGSWNMPEKVRLCIEARDGGVATRGLDASLCSIAEYSEILTNAVYRNSRRPKEIEHAIFDAHGRKRIIKAQEIESVMAAALEDTADTLTALRMPLDMLKFERQAELAREMLAAGTFDNPSTEDELGHGGDAEDEQHLLEAALEACRLQLDSAAGSNIGEFITAVLQAVARPTALDRAIFALVTQNRESIEGRLGAGELVDGALRKFSFKLKPADVLFTVTLARRQDLVVRRDTDGRFERSRAVTALDPQLFCFMPVVADGLSVGCLYVDSLKKGAAMPEWLTPLIGRARDLIAVALERAQARGGNEGPSPS